MKVQSKIKTRTLTLTELSWMPILPTGTLESLHYQTSYLLIVFYLFIKERQTHWKLCQ